MKLLLHLLAGDVRRHRLVIGAWLLLVPVTGYLDGVEPAAGAERTVRGFLDAANGLLSLTRPLLAIAIVPLVLQTHPAVGSDAFWMTRPIPPRLLVTAKALLLFAAFVAVPVVVEAVLMAALGIPAGRLAGVAIEQTLWKTLWLSLLAAAAALTRNLPRFVLLCGGVLIGLAAILMSMAAVSLARQELVPHGGTLELPDPTGSTIFMLLLIVAASGLLFVQYRSRLRTRSVALGALLLVLAIVLPSFWPWPLLAVPNSVPAWADDPGRAGLTAELDAVRTDDDGSGGEWRALRADLRLDGLERSWSGRAGVTSATIVSPDGTRVHSPYASYPSAVARGESDLPPSQAVAEDLLGVTRVVRPGGGATRFENTILLYARNGVPRDFLRGAYEGRFRVWLVRHEILGTLPVVPGARHQHEGYGLDIATVRRTSGQVSLVARVTTASSVFDRQPREIHDYYLRNTSRGEAIFGIAAPEVSASRIFSFGNAGIHVTGTERGFDTVVTHIRFYARHGDHGPVIDPTDDWLRGAELVIMRETMEGYVERTLTIPEVRVGGNAGTPGSDPG